MRYTAVIRTLGRAGDKYQQTLDSLNIQSCKPSEIIVYIAEGYPLPKETIGIERYVYVKKGMVAQRALLYDEVKTDYILFLDDDVFLPPYAVETLYNEMNEASAQVIAPCTFFNNKVSIVSKLRTTLMGKEVCRLAKDDRWAFKVLSTTGFSYNNNPTKTVYESQTNAGPCFFCAKTDFLKVAFHEELWLDDAPYALPEDQVMFYKMYLSGMKILTSFDSGIIHLDAGSTTANTVDRISRLIYSEYRNKLIFWYKFIYVPEKSMLKRVWACLCLFYAFGVQTIKYFIMRLFGRAEQSDAFFCGLKDAIGYIKTI